MLLKKLSEENKKIVTECCVVLCRVVLCCVVCSVIQYGKGKVHPRKGHEGPEGVQV